MSTGRFFSRRFNGLAGKIFLTLGGKGAFVIYSTKQGHFLQILGERHPSFGLSKIYQIKHKTYHETYQRYLTLKYRVPGSEKIPSNYTRSPRTKVFVKAPWKCPDQILCSYLAAVE